MKPTKKPGLYVGAFLILALVPGMAVAGVYFSFGRSEALLIAIAVVVSLVLVSGFCWSELLTKIDLQEDCISVKTPLGHKKWGIPQDIKAISDFGNDYVIEFSNTSGTFHFRSGAFRSNEATRNLDLILEKIRNNKTEPNQ